MTTAHRPRGVPRRDEHPPLGSRDGDDRYTLTQAERVQHTLEACPRYQRARATVVQQSQPATVELVGEFVAARCHLDEDASVARSALFAAWSAWAAEHGVQHGSRAAFSTLLRAAAPSVRSTRRGRRGDRYDGVELRTTPAEGAA